MITLEVQKWSPDYGPLSNYLEDNDYELMLIADENYTYIAKELNNTQKIADS